VKTIEFTANNAPYLAGDRAAFADAVAERMIGAGIAREWILEDQAAPSSDPPWDLVPEETDAPEEPEAPGATEEAPLQPHRTIARNYVRKR